MENLERVEAALLFDLYGELLTGHQRDVWQLYYQEDWSLAEISQSEGISRSAVHDLLDRTEKSLKEYERKLGLMRAMYRRRQVIGQLARALSEAPHDAWRDNALMVLKQLADEEGLADV